MKEILKRIDAFFSNLFLKKLPGIPRKWKEVEVKILPWYAVIVVITVLPFVLAGLGLGIVFLIPLTIFSHMARGAAGVFGLAFGLVDLILLGLAIPGLFRKTKNGWQYLYWSCLLNLAGSLFSFGLGNVFWQLVTIYFLYQVKSYYTEE